MRVALTLVHTNFHSVGDAVIITQSAFTFLKCSLVSIFGRGIFFNTVSAAK